MPIPAPVGKELTPQRQSHVHWPSFIVPVPGTTLAVARDVVFDELTDVDMDTVFVAFVVFKARHAMSLSFGALMLKRMPDTQWLPWSQ